MEPLTVTRRIRLDADLGRVWDVLRDGDGLQGWLADEVELDVAPGAAGRLIDADGRRRAVVVTEVADGHRLGFTWWDEAQPESASTVVLTLEGVGDATTVTVTETIDAGPLAASGSIGGAGSLLAEASVEALFEAGDAWGARLGRLVGLAAPALVAIGA